MIDVTAAIRLKTAGLIARRKPGVRGVVGVSAARPLWRNPRAMLQREIQEELA
jgi:hypothetical protein